MLYTNNKVVIHAQNDEIVLKEQLGRVREYLMNVNLGDKEFVKDETVDYPAYILPEGIHFKHLQNALGKDEVYVRAINEEELILSFDEETEYTHTFTAEEKTDKANEVMRYFKEIEEIQRAAKSVAASFKKQIEDLQDKLDETVDKHIAGHEYRKVQCFVKIDFAAGTKYFIERDTNELIKTEAIKKVDRTLLLKHRLEQTQMNVELEKKPKVEEAPLQSSPL